MAYRYLIYATGTSYNGTIVRESASSATTINEAFYYSDFIIPEIQPLYLWQVTPLVNPNDVIPNTETKINNYEAATAPAPTPQDLATYGEVTGLTSEKISRVLGATAKVPVFTSGGSLQSSGYSIPQLTGLTTYSFEGSGGTHVHQSGNHVIIESVTPSGTTVLWGDIIGPSISAQTDLWNTLTGMTATTAGKIAKVTGASNTIAMFTPGGSLSGSSKQFTTTVRGTGQANNSYVPTEQAVRNAITQSLTAAIILQGDWNALTNSPNLTSGGTGSGYTTGYAWRVSTSGNTSLGGLHPWRIGDLAIKVAQAPGWVQVQSQDIAAIWGNIGGTLSWQTDLWDTLTGMTASINTKLATSIYQTYTGTTAPNAFAKKADAITGATNLGSGNGSICAGISGNKIELKTLSGGTNVTLTCNGNYIGINVVNDVDLVWTGSTANGVGTYVDGNHICSQPNMTFDGSSLSVTGNVRASTYVCAPTISGSTKVCSPIIAGTSCVTSPTVCGTSSVLTPIVCASSCVRSPLISGQTVCATSSAFAPTPSADNNSTCVATTAWHFGQSGNTTPVMDSGSGAIGTSLKWAHADHVHPSDTTKLNVSVFTGYTASTVNKDKKIQLVSISTLNVNVVTPTGVTWNSAPYSANTYLWKATSATTVQIKSAGTYEVQYHVVLKNDTANQTHSIGGYIVKNGASTLANTATAGMVVGVSASGELSLPPVVQTFANNDRLTLALFRIGGDGTVNLVANSVILTLNKLT